MKKETLEEAAKRLQKDKYGIFIFKDADVKGQLVIDTAKAAFKLGMIEGAKWQAERMYSEEEVIRIARESYAMGRNIVLVGAFNKWLEKFKKS
jgi:hypothetical protein